MIAILSYIMKKICRHEFAIEDLKMVNPDGVDDRVMWPCAKCGKEFRAHCGLNISPTNGPIFRRNNSAQGEKP